MSAGLNNTVPGHKFGGDTILRNTGTPFLRHCTGVRVYVRDNNNAISCTQPRKEGLVTLL